MQPITQTTQIIFPAHIYGSGFVTPFHPIQVKLGSRFENLQFKVYADTSAQHEASFTFEAKSARDWNIVMCEPPSTTRFFHLFVFDGAEVVAQAGPFTVVSTIDINFESSVVSIEQANEVRIIHKRIDGLSAQMTQLSTLLQTICSTIVSSPPTTEL